MTINVTLYQMVAGRIEPTVTCPLDNCIKEFEALGLAYQRDNINPRHREELQGAPIFAGIVGPMWDGRRGIRYEDAETFRQMSQ